MTHAPIITLDGPSGAGKGTLASGIARELGWWLLDSGALYRLVGLMAHRRGLSPDAEDDRQAAAEAARALDIVFEPDSGAGQRIWLAGEDVTTLIRENTISEAASRWAVVPAVRDALLSRQRAFVAAPGLVADGRDMGTVVFPEAELKLFITASAEERARRRFEQLSATSTDATIHQLYRDIKARDARDASRSVSPLQPAVDACVIDTTGETVAGTMTQVRAFIRENGWL